MLYLIQHGEAKEANEDPNRDLSPLGETHARSAGRFLATNGVNVERIWHSGKLRAAHTAEIIAEELKAIDRVEERTGLRPIDDPAERIPEIQVLAASGLIIVSHLPFLPRLTTLLLSGGTVRFRNSGIVALSREDGDWAVEWVLPPDLIP